METILEPIAIKYGFEIDRSNTPFITCRKRYPWGVLCVSVEKQNFSSFWPYTETVRFNAISIEYFLDSTFEVTEYDKNKLDFVLSNIQPYLAKNIPLTRQHIL